MNQESNYMRSQIKVSVIIPTYNRQSTILDSVESVLRQSYGYLECIVVDDCSDDGTEDIIRGIADKRVKYIKNSSRSGPAKSRNIGIRHATGSVIGFNDSDDVWRADKLSIQLDVLFTNPNCAMVYCVFHRTQGDTTRRVPPYGIPREFLSGKMYNFLLQGNVIGTPTMLIKKECFMAVGGFDEGLKALEDYDLALKVSKDHEIGYVDQCLVDGYSFDNGVSSHKLNAVDACIRMYKKTYDSDKKNRFLPMIFSGISLLTDTEIKNRMIDYLKLELCIDEGILDYALDMSEKKMRLLEKQKALIDLIKNADFSAFWDKFFQDMNEDKVAVYGCGDLGRALAGQFQKTNVNFCGFIDNAVVAYKGIPVYNIGNIPEEIEVIIITVYDVSLKVEVLARNTKAKLLRLNDVLNVPI